MRGASALYKGNMQAHFCRKPIHRACPKICTVGTAKQSLAFFMALSFKQTRANKISGLTKEGGGMVLTREPASSKRMALQSGCRK